MKNARWFWALIAAQAAFLLAWAGWHEHVRSHGQVVRLKTRPVDPQDLLRGDYMILAYEIGRVAPPPEAVASGREFWVTLAPRDGYYEAVSANVVEPKVGWNEVLVLARSGRRGVEFGIENYYVPEGKGSPRFKKIEVEAAVSSTHRLSIKRVLLDGKAYP